ncbi:MAG: SRPBCC family protein [Acidobacteriota bacterium]
MRWVWYALAGVGGLLVVAVIVLLVLGRAGARMTATLEINRPPEQVFPWLTEPARLTRWVSWLQDVRDESPGVTGVGQRARWMMDDPNMNQIVELVVTTRRQEPNRLLEASVSSPVGFDGTVTYALVDLGGRTRLEHSSDYRFHQWFARLMTPVIMPSAEKKLEGDLARLKALIEAE